MTPRASRHEPWASDAPYVVGDRVNVLRSEGGATMSGPLTIERVTPINPDLRGRRWRLHMTRSDGTPLEVTVYRDGTDRHGYVEPVGK